MAQMVLYGTAMLATISLVVTWLFQFQVGRHRRTVEAAPTHAAPWRPAVSILKPLAGLDEGLEDNLRSMARQAYPRFELVFGVQDPGDRAAAVVAALSREFPAVPMRLVVGSPARGLNPKVQNLAGMAAHAAHEVLLISDANVRAGPDYLATIVDALADPSVGLVCNVIGARYARSVGAACEDLHLNTFVAASVCAAFTLAQHPCVVGKSMLIRRTDLAAAGGWEGVDNVLAEDYVLGRRVAALGRRVALSPHVVEAVHLRRTVRQFASRHLRWAQMRRRLNLVAYVGELLLNPTAWALPLLVLGAAAGAPWAMGLAAAVITGKVLGDALVCRLLRGRWVPAWQLLLVPAKDVVVAAIWAIGFFRRKISWRGHDARLGPGSSLSPLPRPGRADSPHGPGPAAAAPRRRQQRRALTPHAHAP